MSSSGLSDFGILLRETLIPAWVDASDRDMEASSYRGSTTPLSDYDAAEFMRAWNAGMLHHFERGRYQFRQNGSIEQFFSSGPKSQSPRPFSLWLEPVIQVGALARLHFDFGWPEALIGTQSIDGAFDVIAFRSDRGIESIAGEVKKTVTETTHLIELMRHFGADPFAQEPASGSRRNAFKKVVALRQRRPPIFWAIGPNRFSRVYRVSYFSNGQFEFELVGETELQFSC